MKNPKFFVFWGGAGHAKVLSDVISILGSKVIAVFDNQNVASPLPNVPIYYGEAGFLDWISSCERPQNIGGLAAIGGARGRDRMAIHALFRKYHLALPVIVHPSAVVSTSAVIGPGGQVLALAQVGADAHIGEAVIINHHASVDHECKIGNGVHLAPRATLCGCVTLADHVFIGAGAVVLPRLSIGENAIVGAGAVVTQDIPPGVTVVGNPAKLISKS